MTFPATIDETLELLKQRTHDAELYQHLGDLYFKYGPQEKAWSAYMQSLKLNPDDPWTCLKFGALLSICDDKSHSMQLFKHALKVAPEIAACHWSLAELYRRQKKYKEAGKSYRRAVAADPDNETARDKLAEWEEYLKGLNGGEKQPS